MVKQIKDKKRPMPMAKINWLDAWIDWPKFTAHHPLDLPFQLPKMELTVEGRKGFMRPELKMQFAEPLGLKLEPWWVPTNLISSPVASITLARGFGPLLSRV